MHIDRADLAAAAVGPGRAGRRSPSSPGRRSSATPSGWRGRPSAGPVQVDGSGWAADLLRGATTHPPAPIDTPDGFAGQLRSYQAEAAGWLGFLDRAGLGGCLAMDMGLGKTPDPAGPLLVDRGHGPDAGHLPAGGAQQLGERGDTGSPAGLKVAVHHGPRRAEGDGDQPAGRQPDIVLTTYATAVRDIVPLSAIDLAPGGGRRGPGDQEPPERHRPGAAAAVRPTPGSP